MCVSVLGCCRYPRIISIWMRQAARRNITTPQPITHPRGSKLSFRQFQHDQLIIKSVLMSLTPLLAASFIGRCAPRTVFGRTFSAG